MSMHDALRAIGIQLPWMRREEERQPDALPPPSPVDDVLALLRMANGVGRIEPQSPTWAAVQKWAATEIIGTQAGLETAQGERAAALRTRIAVLRELLAQPMQSAPPVFEQSEASYAP
jgi:hypothetical protein